MKTKLLLLYKLIDEKNTKLFWIILGLSLLAALLEMIGLGILPMFVTFLSNPDSFTSNPKFSFLAPYTENKSRESLAIWGTGILLVFFALKTVYTLFVYFMQAIFVRNIISSTGISMFSRYMRAPYKYHIEANNNEIIRNVTHSPQYFGAAVALPIMQIILNCAIIFVSIIVLIMYDPYTTISALLIPGVTFFCFHQFIKRKTSYYGRQLQDSLSRALKIVNQGLGSFKETQVNGTQDYITSEYNKSFYKIGKSFEFQKFASSSVKPILEFFGMCTLAMIMAFSMYSTGSLESTLPSLILISAVIARVLPSGSQIISNLTSLKSYFSIVDDLAKDCDELSKLSNNENKKDTIISKNYATLGNINKIEVRNLYFKHDKAVEHALKNISFEIEKGHSVAIIGPSGAGKSTLIDNLLGLLAPTSGDILINDFPIRSTLTQWRTKIGYIPQNIFLIDDSIRKNVAFGVPPSEINEDKIWKALELAELSSTVKKQPLGLETKVGERGIRFSGGQCQRIGIARALYTDPEVLILDEATSALDPSTEKRVLQNIFNWKKDQIVIMITHRIISARICNSILVLKNGEIIDTGEFNELSSLN